VRLNRGGLIACGLYTLHFAVFGTLAYFVGLKPSVLLAELAVLPAGIVLGGVWPSLGLHDPPFAVDSWMNSYLLYYPVSLVVSYLFGWAIHGLWCLLIRTFGKKLDRLDEKIVERLDKRS